MPVTEKSQPKRWRLAFDQECEANPSGRKPEKSELSAIGWMDQFEPFFKGSPEQLRLLEMLPAHPKYFFLAHQAMSRFFQDSNQPEMDLPPGMEAFLGQDSKDPADAMKSGFKVCLRSEDPVNAEELSGEEIDSNRRKFIQKLAEPIEDSMAKDRFIGIMEGMLAEEPDEEKWFDLYDKNFGWTAGEMRDVYEDTLAFERSMADDLAEDSKLAAKLAVDPHASGYLAGLLSRAEQVYGVADPDFALEYRAYVEFTLNSLTAEGKLENLSNLEGILKTPDDYRETGFLNFPKRPKDALSGSEFMEKILGVKLEDFKDNSRQLGKLSKVQRENAILEQIELGNIPSFLRRPKPVVISGPDGSEVTTWVMPDYIAIGSDENFVRVPLSPIVAQALARKYNLSLPTKTIVEETYEQAGKRVVGPFYSRAKEMELNSAYLDSAGFYLRSSEDIQNQLEGVEPGTLISGGKKELVISNFVSERYRGGKPDESIAFYGLYDANGIPIQRTPGHGGEMGYRHTEYALGVRFISPILLYRSPEGVKKTMRMEDALQDPEVAKVINRLERTDQQWQVRSTLMDGLFDPATVYSQKPTKDQKMPHGLEHEVK